MMAALKHAGYDNKGRSFVTLAPFGFVANVASLSFPQLRSSHSCFRLGITYGVIVSVRQVIFGDLMGGSTGN